MSRDQTQAYLAALPADQRAALEKVRRQILAAAPLAEPHFGYGLPGFTLRGHPFIYFGAAKAHCAIYGNNDAKIIAQLGRYKHSKGAIQFTPAAPLPAALIKTIVQTRAAANEAKWSASAKTGARPATAAKAPAKTISKPAAKKPTKAVDGSVAVEAFLASFEHPQQALVRAIRDDLRRAAPTLAERVKWKGPSTHLDGVDFSAFNLRANGFVQLILLFPNGLVADEAGLLEGTWADRRFVRFVDDADRRKKRAALTRLVRAWVAREQQARQVK